MITLIEALNYQCLQRVSQPLDQFQILVGPNASGKSTFLDVIEFVRDVVKDDLPSAVGKRTRNPQDLLFQRKGKRFELALEARVPPEIQEKIKFPQRELARYQISIEFNQSLQQFELVDERVLLLEREGTARYSGVPDTAKHKNQNSLMLGESEFNAKNLVSKSRNGTATFATETEKFLLNFNFKPQKSALGELPEDDKLFPASIWLRNLLLNGGQRVNLNSKAMSKPSPPGQSSVLLPDGSNLSRIVAKFRKLDSKRYRFWVEHLQMVIPGLEDIRTHERPEDRHCYMIFKFSDGLELPSWMISEGALRLAALTLPAYFRELQKGGLFIVEEPENGIHPNAIEAAFDALSSMYDSQVLLITHSPVVVNLSKLENLICLKINRDGATDAVAANKLPILQNWERTPSLGWLLASGALG